MKQSKAEKMIDGIIERAYYRSCRGVQIDIMDIDKVFAHGRRLFLGGIVNDDALAGALREYVDTIAVQP